MVQQHCIGILPHIPMNALGNRLEQYLYKHFAKSIFNQQVVVVCINGEFLFNIADLVLHNTQIGHAITPTNHLISPTPPIPVNAIGRGFGSRSIFVKSLTLASSAMAFLGKLGLWEISNALVSTFPLWLLALFTIWSTLLPMLSTFFNRLELATALKSKTMIPIKQFITRKWPQERCNQAVHPLSPHTPFGIVLKPMAVRVLQAK